MRIILHTLKIRHRRLDRLINQRMKSHKAEHF